MFSSEKRNLREKTSQTFLLIEENNRELKVKELYSHKFLLNRANIFLKKDKNEVCFFLTLTFILLGFYE